MCISKSIRIVGTFLFLCLGVKAQVKDHVKLVDHLFQDYIYSAIIEGKDPITMYLHYNEPTIPSGDEFSIYYRFGSIRGWYWYDQDQVKIPLIGYWDRSRVSLYVPNSKEGIPESNTQPEGYPDSFFIHTSDGPQITINYKEMFSLSAENGVWTQGNNSKPVVGFNFQENDLERRIQLLITRENKADKHIDITDLIYKVLPTDNYAMVGMNGFGEFNCRLRDFSFDHGNINVLLELETDGPCNISYSKLVSISLNRDVLIHHFNAITKWTCLLYGSELRPEESTETTKVYQVVVGEKSWGKYSIQNAQITVIKAWE